MIVVQVTKLDQQSTFTLQQEVSPEGDNRRLLVQFVVLLGEVDGEEIAEHFSCERLSRPTENTKEDIWEELNLDQNKKLIQSNSFICSECCTNTAASESIQSTGQCCCYGQQ